MFSLNMNKGNDLDNNLNGNTLCSIKNFPQYAALKWLNEIPISFNQISLASSSEL